MKRFTVQMVADFAGLVLLIFCGAGVYWNSLSWWHDRFSAELGAWVVPVALLYLALKSPRLRSGIAERAIDETSSENSRTLQRWNDEEELVRHIEMGTVFRDHIHRGWTVQQIEEAIAEYTSSEKKHSIRATLDFVNKARGAFGLEALNDLPAASRQTTRDGRGPIWKALEPIGCDYLNRDEIYFKTPEAARDVASATGAKYYDSIHTRVVHPSWEVGQVQIWWEAGNLPEYVEPIVS